MKLFVCVTSFLSFLWTNLLYTYQPVSVCARARAVCACVLVRACVFVCARVRARVRESE